VGALGALVIAVAASSLIGPGRGTPSPPDLHLPRPVDPSVQMSVVTTVRGHGRAAHEGDTVRVRYKGRPPSEAAASESRGAGAEIAFVLGAGQVIEGWDEGLVGMKAGEKRRLVIPPALAYGARGSAEVMPGETLVYEVELLAVVGEGHDD
jgi:FKBP-type peptidyl-prolyl cis-trans isomerase